ncbi:hypothetical protein VLK31_20890 [Variovorax sp. H27-G14]|uniref:helix-turn-helix transcriptional regulator n=1 Tax=Variovorax sp. H27-G14 TaxID=3111914 RepID=UPI0038FD2B72
MPNANQMPIPAARSYQLIRKKRLLEKVPFSKTTLHAKMAKGPYQDTTFPLPIYFPNSRIPYWPEDAIDNWIALAERRSFQGNKAFGELGHTTAQVSSSLTAPQAEPENPLEQSIPNHRDAIRSVLTAADLNGRPKQISVAVGRKRAAMPIAVAPVAQTPLETRTEAVAPGHDAELWTYTSETEESIQGQPERLLPMPHEVTHVYGECADHDVTPVYGECADHEVTPVYGECAGIARARQVAPERPPASPVFPTGRL